MKTVIMVGGHGTRIAELFSDIPKPLIPIRNSTGVEKPVLEWEIESLVKQGYKDIILTVGYMADKIQRFFGDGSQFGCHIDYWIEETPLGNAGALIKCRDKLSSDPFLLLISDAVFDPDKGFEGEVAALKTDCDCRKPRPGLILKASEDFNIDLSCSWMIGDGKNDVGVGKMQVVRRL